MAYTVLARRYRSQSFGSVVGQTPIASTLTNAIKTGRVAHAYLFTGTRGVGKTSMARIFARALNAPTTVDDAPQIDSIDYPEPDAQERMATAIMRGDDMNVIEIDGASNNSVDQARQLIANAGLSPTANAPYKVYIIDEVHMLSGAAFNALLKTMEEPPSHVKFILCTTEPHKVPPTIQSRCQRFDFRNIATAKIAEHLNDVLKGEKIEAESEVVWQVARLGNGSMRDALSLMDRLLATGDSPLTAKTLQDMLGLPDHELIAALIDAMAEGNVKGTLTGTADLLGRGIGMDQLIEVLIERLRQLMLVAACGIDSELVELSEDAKPQAEQQAKRFDAAGLVHMIALCENLQRAAKSSSNPRALLDATVVRLALSEKMADVTAVLSGAATALPAGSAEKKKLSEGAPPHPTRSDSPPSEPGRPRPGPSTVPPSHATTSDNPGPGRGRPGSLAPSTPAQPHRPDAPPLVPAPSSLDPSDLTAVWAAVLQALGQSNASAWLGHFKLVELDAESSPARATIAPAVGSSHARNFATGPRLQRVSSTIASLLNQPVIVNVAAPKSARDHQQDPASPSDNASTNAHPAEEDDSGHLDRREALDIPLVREAFDVFQDVTLIDARRADKGKSDK